ncbi:MAG: CoA transferase [Halomonas sp.]|uniref:CaiB/BaiF CoA transferase family protein n=1 Tax=Halomonas sp. TaxID=1486246 RepID=UPI001A09D4B6|nr:CoA transferase [Halomonas sp.]MBE0490170.1 CoA transferase [Halomonas sp.]
MNAPLTSLNGIRVIDLSRVLGGPYCTQVLADHGADVIKIEPPSGDETRSWGPPFSGDASSYFHGLNRGKRGMALDLRQESGRALLLELLETADVLVENFKPGTLEKWGLGHETLKTRFPRLIHCRISGFGADGPLGGLPGYDAVIQAMAGLMSVNGEADGEPLRVGLPVVDIVTGLNAVIGITLALHERVRSGEGQFVEAALFDSGLALMHPHFPNVFFGGPAPRRTGNAHPNIAPYEVYRTATRPLFLTVGNNGQFAKLCELLGCPELVEDPRFVDNGARLTHREALREALEAVLADQDGTTLAERLIRAGVPCGPVMETHDILAHPHTAHREMIVDIGAYRGTGSPIKLGRTPACYRRPPPRFAEHTDEILTELGVVPARLVKLRAQGVIPEPRLK